MNNPDSYVVEMKRGTLWRLYHLPSIGEWSMYQNRILPREQIALGAYVQGHHARPITLLERQRGCEGKSVRAAVACLRTDK